jgi:hypothetical protein
MSISKKSIHSVLKRVYAADVETKGKEDVPKMPDPLKEDVPTKETDTLQIINRIFFYDIDANKKISFSNLNEILTGADEKSKDEQIENLKGGNTADFHADYFKWRSVCIKAVSQKDKTKVVVYSYDLNPWGTKASGGEMVKTNVAGFNPPSPEDMVKDTTYKIFATFNEIQDMINLSQGPEAIYSTDNVSDQFSNRLLTAEAGSTVSRKLNYDNFKTNIFAYYRIWVPLAVNELRNVDGSKPTTDQLPVTLQRTSPGHYKGGGDFFKKFMAEGKYKVGEEKPEVPMKEPAAVPGKKPTQAPEFTPVTTKEASYEEKDSKIREINKDDPNVNQYLGDFSIMQDLVKRQHKKMKIRKEAMEKDAATPIPGRGGTPWNPPKINTPVPIGNVQEIKKVVDPLINMSKKMESLMKGMPSSGAQTTTQGVGTGMGKYSSEKVKNVLKNYFNS